LYEAARQLEMFSGVRSEGNSKSLTYSEVHVKWKYELTFDVLVISVRYCDIMQLNCLLNIFDYRHLDLAHLNQ